MGFGFRRVCMRYTHSPGARLERGDRSFIRDITHAPDKAAIAAAITSMARTLKMSVIAEGVETGRQAYYLQERGCHEIQGYLVSPPVPAIEASRFLRAIVPGPGASSQD